METVKSGVLAAVYVYDQDRLSREPRDTINLMYIFEQSDCRLLFLTGPQDESWLGQMMRMMLSFAAKQERLQFLERANRGRRERAKEGKLPCGTGRGIYGYDKVAPSTYSINEQEAQTVIGSSATVCWKVLPRARRRTEQDGDPDQGRLSLDRLTVSQTLKNEAYIGTLYFGRYQHGKDSEGKATRKKSAPEDVIRIEGATPRIIPRKPSTT